MYKFALWGIVALFAGTVACSSAESSDSAETAGALSSRDQCGGNAGIQCSPGSYCHYEIADQCGAADQLGTCKVEPQFCNYIHSPVCGCDNNTYENSCWAARVGTSVAWNGTCEGGPTPPAPPRPCGGNAVLPCDTDQFCNYTIDAMCGAADQGGTCTKIAELCPAIVKPVCGCDHKDYSNECEANRAGVAVFSLGNCAN